MQSSEHVTGVGQPPYPVWNRYRQGIYGYGILDAPNATHLTWSFLSSEDGSLLDQFTLVKDA